jgi:hypothetical protein
MVLFYAMDACNLYPLEISFGFGLGAMHAKDHWRCLRETRTNDDGCCVCDFVLVAKGRTTDM